MLRVVCVESTSRCDSQVVEMRADAQESSYVILSRAGRFIEQPYSWKYNRINESQRPLDVFEHIRDLDFLASWGG